MLVGLLCLLGADLVLFPSCLSWSWLCSDLSGFDVLEDHLVRSWLSTGLVHGLIQVHVGDELISSLFCHLLFQLFSQLLVSLFCRRGRRISIEVDLRHLLFDVRDRSKGV